MKKIIVLVLCLIFLAFGKLRQVDIKQHTANTTTPEAPSKSASEIWYYQGPAKDTSRVFFMQGKYKTFAITALDTSSGGDSVSLKFRLYGAENDGGLPSTFTEFQLLDSVSVAAETNKTSWVYETPDSSRPDFSYYYFVLDTLSKSNSVSTPVQLDVDGITWEN